MNNKQTAFLSILTIILASGLIFVGSGFVDGLVNGKTSPVDLKQSKPQAQFLPQGPGSYAAPSESGCPCCGSGAIAGSTGRLAQAESSAVTYYAQKYGGSGNITAKSFDSGCHIEVSLYVDGVFVKKLAVYGDRVTEV